MQASTQGVGELDWAAGPFSPASPTGLRARATDEQCNVNQHSGGRDRRISEFQDSLVYRMSVRTARALIQRNSVLRRTTKDWYGTLKKLVFSFGEHNCLYLPPPPLSIVVFHFEV